MHDSSCTFGVGVGIGIGIEFLKADSDTDSDPDPDELYCCILNWEAYGTSSF
jgi:hypothetical protein